MNWKNAAAASWKSFKSFVLLIWSLYDCEPDPEAIARKKEREAAWAAEVERMDRERLRKGPSYFERAITDLFKLAFFVVVVVGIIASFVFLGPVGFIALVVAIFFVVPMLLG